MVAALSLPRRALLGAGLTAALGGCADAPTTAEGGADGADPADRPPAAGGRAPWLSPWRTVTGGFLSPSLRPGAVPQPGTGMFVSLRAPRAVALRGPELLVLDSAAQSLWRVDTGMGTLSGVAGAPTPLQAALLLGPDLSAWVLDPQQHQVLRFARDGRLLQTWRIDHSMPSPVAMALLDQGATLLVADGLGAQWSEQRGPSGVVLPVLPRHEGERRIGSVDAVLPAGPAGADRLWVLDRLGVAVHLVQRDGRVLATLGRGELLQPEAMAADRWGRVFVVDRQGATVVVLQSGQTSQRLDANQLRVQQIASLALDNDLLAVSDRLLGQVVLHRLARPAAP